jgi:hypothetical protein
LRGLNLRVQTEQAGKKVKCAACGKTTPVPVTKASGLSTAAKSGSWARTAVSAGIVSALVLACVIVLCTWMMGGNQGPYENPLQPAAQKVRTLETDSIDARNYPMIIDKDLWILKDLPNLKKLNLDHTEITDEGMKEIGRIPSLLALSLTDTRVSDAGLAELKNVIGLEDLRLDKLAVGDVGLASLGAFPQLRRLSLYQTKVTDAGLIHLQKLFFLENLSLDETQITDVGLSHLGELQNLRYVSLWRTNVTEAGVQKLRQALPKLKINK